MITSFGAIEALLVVGGVLAYLLCQMAHDVAIARAALACGDSTARDCGRTAFDPRAHIDPLRTLLLPLVLVITTGLPFGCGRSLPVCAAKLRRPGRDIVLVSLAGPAANLALGIIFGLAIVVMLRLRLLDTGGLGYLLLVQGIWINLLLCVVNLIPLPPLDASRVLAFFLPAEHRAGYEGIGIYGLLFLVAAFFSPLGEFAWSEAHSLGIEFEYVAQLFLP